MDQPLDQLDDLWEFRPLATSADTPRVAMPEISQDLSRPKLLVCHDYKGGYTEHLSATLDDIGSAYTINQWELIDTFVYFSHHLVTIPPAQWIAVAHRNGTQVLGTFIAEHDEGAALCEQAFALPETACQTATQLAAVAASSGFEGWLINLEVKLEASLIPHIILFLTQLTTLMRRQCGNNSLVIWYDAITKDGKLEWQDTLNTNNDCFLTACDGLFTNYGWEAGYPKQASAVAGRRKADVYFGTDVYGRGTFGGGGMNSGAAVAAAQAEGFSAALFAPGWVHEADHSDQLTLQQRQQIFWSEIKLGLTAPRPPMRASSFYSNFDQGCGLATFNQGRRSSAAPWYDLSKAALQPLQQTQRPVPGVYGVVANATMACAFDGGSCWAIAGSFFPSVYVPLFATDLLMPEPQGWDHTVKVTMTAACHSGHGAFTLVLKTKTMCKGVEYESADIISPLDHGQCEDSLPCGISRSPRYHAAKVIARYPAGTAAAAAAAQHTRLSPKVRDCGAGASKVLLPASRALGGSEWLVQEAQLDLAGSRFFEIGVICHHLKPSGGNATRRDFSGHVGSIDIQQDVHGRQHLCI